MDEGWRMMDKMNVKQNGGQDMDVRCNDEQTDMKWNWNKLMDQQSKETDQNQLNQSSQPTGPRDQVCPNKINHHKFSKKFQLKLILKVFITFYYFSKSSKNIVHIMRGTAPHTLPSFKEKELPTFLQSYSVTQYPSVANLWLPSRVSQLTPPSVANHWNSNKQPHATLACSTIENNHMLPLACSTQYYWHQENNHMLQLTCSTHSSTI